MCAGQLLDRSLKLGPCKILQAAQAGTATRCGMARYFLHHFCALSLFAKFAQRASAFCVPFSDMFGLPQARSCYPASLSLSLGHGACVGSVFWKLALDWAEPCADLCITFASVQPSLQCAMLVQFKQCECFRVNARFTIHRCCFAGRARRGDRLGLQTNHTVAALHADATRSSRHWTCCNGRFVPSSDLEDSGRASGVRLHEQSLTLTGVKL